MDQRDPAIPVSRKEASIVASIRTSPFQPGSLACAAFTLFSSEAGERRAVSQRWVQLIEEPHGRCYKDSRTLLWSFSETHLTKLWNLDQVGGFHSGGWWMLYI